ncbi:MAG: uroporphyrinogen decarboxylase family protein [Phycisphaerae bacterium]
MEQLTRRENFLRAARRQSFQWIPLDFGLNPGALLTFKQNAGAQAKVDEYFNFDGKWLSGRGTMNRPLPDYRKLYFADGSLPENAVIDEYGMATVTDPATDDQQHYYPMRNFSSAQDVDAFPWPSAAEEASRYEGLTEQVSQAQAAGFCVHVSGAQGWFQGNCELMGYDNFLMHLGEDSPVARRLMERWSERQVWRMEQCAKSGADIIQSGDDVATQIGTMISPAMFREQFFPQMRAAIQAAKRINPQVLIRHHCCGNCSAVLEDYIAAGVDILDPCQPECMDLFELKRRYGKSVSFHGGIGVQSVLPHGTPQEVRDAVRRTVDVMADGGGYLCSSSHSIGRDVPWANIVAMVEALREYGAPPPVGQKYKVG